MNVIDFKISDVFYIFLETNNNTCKNCHCKIYEKDKYIIVKNYYLEKLEYNLICNRCVIQNKEERETIMKYCMCIITLLLFFILLCFYKKE